MLQRAATCGRRSNGRATLVGGSAGPRLCQRGPTGRVWWLGRVLRCCCRLEVTSYAATGGNVRAAIQWVGNVGGRKRGPLLVPMGANGSGMVAGQGTASLW